MIVHYISVQLIIITINNNEPGRDFQAGAGLYSLLVGEHGGCISFIMKLRE